VAVVTSLSEGRQPFTDVAKFALRDLSKWHRMVLALSLMPDQLGKEDSRWAKQLLYALVQEKAPKANLEDWVPPKISSKRQP
jgi:hypothetical protein